MTTGIGECDSDQYDFYTLDSTARRPNPQDEIFPKIEIAFRENHYDQILELLDIALKQLEILPEVGDEEFKVFNDYLATIARAFCLVMTDRPMEAIAICSGKPFTEPAHFNNGWHKAFQEQALELNIFIRAFASLKLGETDPLKTLITPVLSADIVTVIPINEFDLKSVLPDMKLPNDFNFFSFLSEMNLQDNVSICSSFCTATGKSAVTIHSDGSFVTITISQSPPDISLSLELGCRLLEQQLGVTIFEKQIIAESEFEEMSLHRKINFCLLNKDPEQAIQWINSDDQAEDYKLEKAIAYALMGNKTASVKCLEEFSEDTSSDEDPSDSPLSQVLLGNFEDAKENAKSELDLPWLLLIHELESSQKTDLSLARNKV